MNLVRAAADLEGDLPGEARVHDQIGDLDRPALGVLAAGQEVVVLEQEDRDAAAAVQVDHLVDDRSRCAEPAQRAALLLVERPDAAEGAVPRTPAAAENRRRRHRMAFVVDGLPVRQGEDVEVLDHARQRCDADVGVARAKRDPREAPPVRLRWRGRAGA